MKLDFSTAVTITQVLLVSVGGTIYPAVCWSYTESGHGQMCLNLSSTFYKKRFSWKINCKDMHAPRGGRGKLSKIYMKEKINGNKKMPFQTFWLLRIMWEEVATAAKVTGTHS